MAVVTPQMSTEPPPDTPPQPASGAGVDLAALLRALRPKQWIKNGFLFAGILFTLDRHHPLSDWLLVLAGFAIFCALSSAIYLVNDLYDLEQDRRHPSKRHRPIAAGLVSARTAVLAAVILALGAMVAAGATRSAGFIAAACAYLAVTLAYSSWLKHQVLIDVMTLASGFVMRAVAGAAIINAEISPWLLVCTTLLALFLGLAKRRTELATLQEDAKGTRRILEEYSVELLDQLITIVTASVLMAYALYTIESQTARQHPLLVLTLPFVVYGIFRFLYLVHRRQGGGSPTSDLLEDRPLLLTAILWAAASAAALLGGR